MIQKLANKKLFLLIIAFLFIGSVVIFSVAFSKRDALATVEGEKITKDELYNMLVERYGADTLDMLIDNKIIELEVKKEKVDISNEEIEDELASYIESYGGEEAFHSALEQSGFTEEHIKGDMKQYLAIKKLLEPQIEVTDEEMKAYFEENKTAFSQEEQVKASHILVEDEAEAKVVAEKLAGGADFSELAAEYSTDAATAENGGDLGYFAKGTMVEEFDNVAFSLEKGKISDPVKTEYGYHIIKIMDKKAAKEAVYDEHKEEIKETLFEEKLQSEYPIWMGEKKEEYDIKNSLEKY